jgi:hypothetical protein
MTYIPPAHTPYQWQDTPSVSTPLSAENLIASQTDLVQFTQAAVSDLASHVLGSDGKVGGPGSGGLSLPWVLASAHGISPSGTASANATALAALIGNVGPLANGGVLVCDWIGTALFDTSATNLVPNAANLTVVGLGWQTVMKMGGAAENTTSTELPLWWLTGSNSSLELRDITLQGTDALGSGGRTSLVLHGGTGGQVKLRNVYLKHASFGVQLNATGALTSIDMDGCVYEGFGTGTATYACQGVGCFEASPVAWVPSKRVSIRNTRFTKFGDPNGGALAHAIYCYTTWGLHVENCEFDNPATGTNGGSAGYCIQHYDGAGFAANLEAQESAVVNCVFGADLLATQGVYTNASFPTTISGCSFQRSTGTGPDLRLAFDAKVIDCTFNHHGDQNIQSAGAGTSIIDGCVFQGVIGSGCASVYVDDPGAVFEVSNCHFSGATNGNGYYLLMNDVGEIRAKGCRFDGNPSRAVFSYVAGILSVTGSKFTTANYAIGNGSTALAELHVRDNDISPQSGGVVFDLSVVPTVLDIANNYGTPGYQTRSAGVASVADGGTISHGLGDGSFAVTPTKYMVSPSNPAHIVAVTAVSSTTLTVAIKAASNGAAVTTAENVAWSAEA